MSWIEDHFFTVLIVAFIASWLLSATRCLWRLATGRHAWGWSWRVRGPSWGGSSLMNGSSMFPPADVGPPPPDAGSCVGGGSGDSSGGSCQGPS